MKFVFIALLTVSQAIQLSGDKKATHSVYPALGQLAGKNSLMQDPEEIFDMLDLDSDDILTFDEMIEFYESQMGPVPKSYYPEIRTEFDLVDTDRDGLISREDYLDYMDY